MEERVIMDTNRFFARNDLDKKLKPVMEKASQGDADSQFSVANQILEIVKNSSSKLYLLWMEEAAGNGCVMAQFLLSEDKNIPDRLKYDSMLVDNPKTPLQVYDHALKVLADDLYRKGDMGCASMYERLLEDDPRSKLASYRLADLYLRQDRKDEAKKMFRLYRRLYKAVLNYGYCDPLELGKKLK